MDVWLLGLFLGYPELPERAAELWEELRQLRKLIAKEAVKNEYSTKIVTWTSMIGEREVELRAILIAEEKKKYERKK